MPGGIVFRTLKLIAFLFLISVAVSEILPNWFFTFLAQGINEFFQWFQVRDNDDYTDGGKNILEHCKPVFKIIKPIAPGHVGC